MRQSDRRQALGLSLHTLIGSLMALAGALVIASAWARLVCLPLPGVVETAVRFGLSDQFLPRPETFDVETQLGHCLYVLIAGVWFLATGLILVAPTTTALGALWASAIWGGIVCLRMTHDESCLLHSALLVLTWAGLYMRNPTALGDLWGCQMRAKPN
jgi:hypothetical protein